jgi:type VI protein secretion system component VasK
MDETVTKMRILARAEMTLAKISAQRAAHRATYYAVAIGLVLLTVVLINVGAYHMLVEHISAATAAFILAGANALLTLVVVFAASRVRAGPEEKLVQEIREMALADLTEDVDEVRKEFAEIGEGVKRLRSGISSVAGGGFGGGLAGAATLITTIIDVLKKHKK